MVTGSVLRMALQCCCHPGDRSQVTGNQWMIPLFDKHVLLSMENRQSPREMASLDPGYHNEGKTTLKWIVGFPEHSKLTLILHCRPLTAIKSHLKCTEHNWKFLWLKNPVVIWTSKNKGVTKPRDCRGKSDTHTFTLYHVHKCIRADTLPVYLLVDDYRGKGATDTGNSHFTFVYKWEGQTWSLCVHSQSA